MDFADFIFFIAVAGIGLAGLAVYFLPTIAAKVNNHPRIGAIAVLNLVAGWTFIGWVVAIVWAFILPEPSR